MEGRGESAGAVQRRRIWKSGAGTVPEHVRDEITGVHECTNLRPAASNLLFRSGGAVCVVSAVHARGGSFLKRRVNVSERCLKLIHSLMMSGMLWGQPAFWAKREESCGGCASWRGNSEKICVRGETTDSETRSAASASGTENIPGEKNWRGEKEDLSERPPTRFA